MISNWPSIPLGELVDPQRGISYGIVQPGSPFPGGVPIVRVSDVRNGRINVQSPLRVAPNIERSYGRTRLRGSELLITIVGTVGETAIVPPTMAGWNVARAIAVVPVNPDIGPYWVQLGLRSSAAVSMIQSRLNTTVQATLNLGDLSRLPIVLPPPRERHAIASILGAFDDKIELNRRMNETLERTARAIFKDWITREDPSPTRKRISDFGNEGVLTIGDGYRAKNSELGGPGIPFIRAGNLKDAIDTQGADTLNEKSAALIRDKISQIGDVAFTSKGTIGRIARVGKFTDKFVYSPQICYWRTTDTETMRPEILYQWMISEDFLSQLHARSGQTDMAPYVSLRDQYAMTIPDFGKNQHTVADTIGPLLDRQDLNNLESRTLAATRDLLLPKLMSGEIRVKDAEEIASEVL
jgi:type I restriction enzyme S subunit